MEWAKKIHITTKDAYKDLIQFEDDFFDLAVVDPPYGGRPAIDPKSSRFVYKAERGDYIEFENVPPPASYFDELRRVSKRQIIWGINYFNYADLPSPGRIVWNKGGKCFGGGGNSLLLRKPSAALCKIHLGRNEARKPENERKTYPFHAKAGGALSLAF
jgi:hypothetical protein